MLSYSTGQSLRLVLLAALGALLLLPACNDNKLDVSAPQRDILVVYGVLNPQAKQQYIRVCKAFLTNGDALQFAATNDLSVRNAIVTLKAKGQPVIRLQPLDTTMKPDGPFLPTYTLFTTTQQIKSNLTYTLEVQLPRDGKDTLWARAHTTIPDTPRVYSPVDSLLEKGTTNIYLWNTLNLDTDADRYKWLAASHAQFENVTDPIRGAAFELRLYLDYTTLDANNNATAQPTLMYGPIQNIVDNQNGECEPDSNSICYDFPKQTVINFWLTKMASGRRQFDNGPKTKALRVEITAVDTFLYNFIRVNSPAFDDFTTAKPEYTNVAMSDGTAGAGILGAINLCTRYYRLSNCSLYLLGLNDTPQPPNCEPQ